MKRMKFQLFRNGRRIRLVVLGDHHWKVVSATKESGFEVGDEVSPKERMSWKVASRRVNSSRSALSPSNLVLLRGKGFECSAKEVAEILRTRLWDPHSRPGA